MPDPCSSGELPGLCREKFHQVEGRLDRQERRADERADKARAEVDAIRGEIRDLRISVEGIKIKVATWSAVAAMVGAGVVSLVVRLVGP